MKTQAAVLEQMGLPAPYAQSRPLRIEDVDLEGPGPGEVLVEMVSAGLCHSDLSTIEGTRPWNMPIVLGHEASGVVREAGPHVRELRPGDRVVFSYVPVCGVCLPCAGGRGWLCENGLRANRAWTLLSGGKRFSRGGGRALHHHLGVSGFARHTVAAQESLVKVGDTSESSANDAIPADIAAFFGCAVMTGVGAVMNTAGVEPGASVAVFGLGGVGLSAVMGARAAGASPIIAVDVLDAKLELARRLGATHTLNAGKLDAPQAIKDLTPRAGGTGGVDYAFECAGSPAALQAAYAATKRGGTTVTAGLPHPSKQFTIPAVSLTAEERTLKGSYMGSCVPRRDIPRFIALWRAGLLPVEALHTRSMPLDEAELNEAFDTLARGEAVRQVIRF